MGNLPVKDYVSIIWVHYSTNEARAELALRCLDSLVKSLDFPSELIVVDNGGKPAISDKLLLELKNGRINTYIRNKDNVWFGKARNQGIAASSGKYIAVIDDDIEFLGGWESECVNILEKTEKRFVTPLQVDRAHLKPFFYEDPIDIDGVRHEVNRWAGSNCWMMKRADWEKLPDFANDQIAGTVWNRHFAKAGYAVVVLPECRALHLGLKGTPYRGYKKKHVVHKIAKVLSDGTEVSP